MHLFYTPDITQPTYTLGAEESRHAVRVMRLAAGDALQLTDGRGNIYTAEVVEADPKACTVRITDVRTGIAERPYKLTMAVAPTKNPDRYEWFLEKATEVGCDTFVPVTTERSERRVFKEERSRKVITSAVKQSLKAWHPELEPLTDVREIIKRPLDGRKLIAHCNDGDKKTIREAVRPGEDALILIGPEGDFSPAEVELARQNGFVEITLGQARLRTETAALAAVMHMAFINQ